MYRVECFAATYICGWHAGRIRNREITMCWTEMVVKFARDTQNLKSQQRAEGIMRRVGGRMKNKELAISFGEWVRNFRMYHSQQRAEGIMRRVGGRMKNKELAISFAEWSRNFRDAMVGDWRDRYSELQA